MNNKVKVALGAAAIGAGLGIAYYTYKKRSQNETSDVELEVLIEHVHVEWLEEIANKYTNGDTNEALCKVIEHCKMVSIDEEQAQTVFKKVRCFTCGKKLKVLFQARLSKELICFIEDVSAKYEISSSQDKALRVMIEYVMKDTEGNVVFGGGVNNE